MITKNKHKFPKKIIATSLVVLLIASVLICVYIFKDNLLGWKTSQNLTQGDNTINYGPATQEQQKAGNQTKSGSSDVPPTPTNIPGSDKKNVQITITSASQNGSSLHIGTLIGAIEDTGTCTLTLTSTGQPTIIKTSTTQALASSSTCQGFDIPISDLPIGTWHILIEFSSSTLTGSATIDKVIK